MWHNESKFDRVIRCALGIALILSSASGFIGLWGLIGIVPLLTGLWGFCPIYRLFNLSSRSL